MAVLDNQRTGLRAVDYLRISTEDQAKGYGVSYTGKRTAKYITKKAWDHVGTYVDEGVSGSLEAHERDDLNRLMENARSVPRPFDVVVVPEARAIGRAGQAFWPWVWELEKLGVFVAVVKKDYDNTTSAGRSQMRKDADYAEDERELIRERTQGGIQDKAEEGGYPGGAPPFGWRIKDQGKLGLSELEVDDGPFGEATLARRARELFVANPNWRATAAVLWGEGFRNRNGGYLTHNNLRQLMTSQTLLTAKRVWRGVNALVGPDGEPVWGKRVVFDLPPIFTDAEVAEFLSAVEKSALQPRRECRVYPLSRGLLISPCQKHYTGQSFRDSGPVYRCVGRVESRPGAKDGCSCPSVPAEVTEKAVWGKVRDVLSDPERLEAMARDRIAAQAEQGASATEKVSELEQRLEEQEDVISFTTRSAAKQARSRGLSGDETESFIERSVAPLGKELAELEKQLRTAREWLRDIDQMNAHAAQVRRLAEAAKGRLDRLEPEQQTVLLHHLRIRAEILGPPVRTKEGKGGTPCALAAWFTQRRRGVPALTDETWPLVDDLGIPREPLHAVLEKAVTGAAWSTLEGGNGLRLRWRRWVSSGAWERAMQALEGAPSRPLTELVQAPPLRIHISPLGLDPFLDGEASGPSAQFSHTGHEVTLVLTA